MRHLLYNNIGIIPKSTTISFGQSYTMLRSLIRPRYFTNAHVLRRSFAKQAPATDPMDDMEQGIVAEMKKMKKGSGELYANAVVREEPSEEFMKEITEAAELYNKKTSQSDKEQRLDLQIKIQLKKEAIEALPENFQGCRISFDKFTAPLDRTPPTETPPIPGFRLFKEGEAPE